MGNNKKITQVRDDICIGMRSYGWVCKREYALINKRFLFLTIQSMIISTTTACSTQVVHFKDEKMAKTQRC